MLPTDDFRTTYPAQFRFYEDRAWLDARADDVIFQRSLAPRYHTPGAAAFDFCVKAPGSTIGGAPSWNGLHFAKIIPGRVTCIDTGLIVDYITPGWCIEVSIRSSWGKKGVVLVNAPGIIDSDYRGRIILLVSALTPIDFDPEEDCNMDDDPRPYGSFLIPHGERIAQGRLVPSPQGRLTSVSKEEFDHNRSVERLSRNPAGFGTTGNL